MKTLAISDFKAHALKILDRIEKTKESVIVTRRGKPLAEVIPFSTKKILPGKLSDALVFEKDIVSPLTEESWNACK
ncbi:MAG: type II toxin-antitoxin system Phd/YefM family antitoxin [Elusimicrobia bacterium HGW-Elusimicrobia-2]|nr:MAG: type II toxin-antitoxin system Phd/YefM family antitoxin [Elusimicrobia bacterium HGW-Elusimicrobia-2]